MGSQRKAHELILSFSEGLQHGSCQVMVGAGESRSGILKG